MRGREAGEEMKAHVIFYTKPGCRLCDEAKAEIERAACADLYIMEEVNIESDTALYKRYGWEIPVVSINGTVAFKYKLTAVDFKRAIENYSKGA